uniref:ATP-dependent DNA helicase n=1 Tax=Sparus aurata TaxID=8175 RepID=A0A671UFX1_SPAAU
MSYNACTTMQVREAVKYLKANNKYYKDIEFNDSWHNDFCREEGNEDAEETENHADSEEAPANAHEDELLHDRQQHCMFQDTCLMPVDIGQETLDQYFDDILNLAPAEGNSPVRLLSDPTNEAKCFPVLFPTGRGTYHDDRQQRLTMSRYFNNRILHADGRFAQNVEYIFFAQYLSEVQQVVSNVSIALRKGKGGPKSQPVSINVLNDEESLRKLLQFDDGFRFLKPIRGTPSFWQGAQRDLLACVRQLGVPTWFCSFSSADMRWQNLLSSILKQAGRTETLEQLDWAQKCELLRASPVTAARMFDFRWHCFLKEVLMSSCHPIGKIKDYFYRVEFQQRGSPHVHCLFWIENAPIIDKNTDEEVIDFIDQYVTCELPAQDDTLLDIVTSVQQHSKQHSKSCKKNKTVCRFNFPKPPSAKTFISRPVIEEDGKTSCKCTLNEAQTLDLCACKNEGQKKPQIMKRDIAVNIMTQIKQALSDDNASFDSVEALFKHLNITQKKFEAAYNRVGRKTQVVLKRQANEVWINQYSTPLLKCWNANIDIQYVVDAYACVVYIISYISKSEKEMGLLLGNAQREAAKEGNSSAKEALKQLGSVYLHNRDVCAQEAVYRLTNMHLKECSRKVVFVPVGENTVRMSLPLSVLKQKASSHDLTNEHMCMRSFVDRYKNRPKDTTFNDMCLATFASEYRVLSKSETAVKKVKLNNDCGFVMKRTRTQPAVVRYVRFSETKSPELFYQSLLQLFLPYHKDAQLKPTGFETFEQFYQHGRVLFSDGSWHSVKDVVDHNRCTFERHADELDTIQNSIDSDGVAEDAWCELCLEQELERLECIEECRETESFEEEPVDSIPDLAINGKDIAHLEKRQNVLSREDGLALLRSLNETQMRIFYQIRQWCLDTRNGAKPDPLHVFITGGAGTGKSHLIKAIQYEAMRLFAKECGSPDDISVLLTAPTGIAAHNLHASTIHNALSIGKDVRLPYTPLGEEKLNSLRTKYRSLQLLIIDEISMVDNKLLSYIHGRLRQIKQSGDYSPFGKVSVIAVGDFYQLPPVKGKALYLDDVGIDLWSQLFKVAELKTIIRQKDPVFAEMLNRVRTRSKGTPLLASDIDLLKRCETGEVSSALHIFPTNRQVNEHNVHQLLKTCPERVEIHAQDYVNSKQTGKLTLIKGHHSRAYDTTLDETLLLGIDARVMLFKNLDVADGLVNGVCGTVTHIVYPHNPTIRFPQTVYVKFDEDRVGAQKRKRCAFASAVQMGSTGIEPEEDRVTKKGGMRRQFPLKLAWACTVHKVQGLTVDNAVVSLDRIFTAGQAYVALSRVRSLSGLIISDFKEKAIYCKDAITNAIENMPPFIVENIAKPKFNTQTFTVFLMNVRNLTKHVSDLALCTQHLQLNCIAVTETWLPAGSSCATVQMDGYVFHNQPRASSYSSSDPLLTEIQGQQCGGVGLYSADNLACNILQVPNVNLECLVYHCTTYNILLAVIYRPPSYHMPLFKDNLGKLLDWLSLRPDTIAVMGDFNDNILKSSSVATFMTNKGFVQTVKQPTTENGTLIDHVYVKTTQHNVESLVLPTYFSDHEGILCSFTSTS